MTHKKNEDRNFLLQKATDSIQLITKVWGGGESTATQTFGTRLDEVQWEEIIIIPFIHYGYTVAWYKLITIVKHIVLITMDIYG